MTSPLVQLLSLATFLAFLALGWRVRLAREPRARRRAINVLLVYVLALSVFVGFRQWDDWPFSSYMILVGRGRVDTSVRTIEFWGEDASGREWRIDPYAWSPLVEMKLLFWYQNRFEGLEPDARKRVLRFLFERAESVRRALAAGRSIGYERRLGPWLSAPHWWLAPRPEEAPSPFVALRVYAASWSPEKLLAEPEGVTRALLAEYRP